MLFLTIFQLISVLDVLIPDLFDTGFDVKDVLFVLMLCILYALPPPSPNKTIFLNIYNTQTQARFGFQYAQTSLSQSSSHRSNCDKLVFCLGSS